MQENIFGQAYFQDIVKMILNKFNLYFLSLILFSMNFRTLNKFLEFLI
jgi:hypothetical protein